MADKTKNQSAVLHAVVQSKGGVGKSFIASLLAQYLMSSNVDVIGVDCDPQNQRLSKYKKIPIQQMNLLETDDSQQNIVRQREFDVIAELSVKSPSTQIVVDVGSNVFLQFGNFLQENGIPEFLKSNGGELLLHVPVTGGAMLEETLIGLWTIQQSLPHTDIVLWKNNWAGQVQSANEKGKMTELEDMKVVKTIAKRLRGIISLPYVNQQTLFLDLQKMLDDHLTFAEVASHKSYRLMEQQRLKSYSEGVFAQLAKVL